METQLKYREFKHQKELDELQYETDRWKVDLDFIDLELLFLKQLIQTFSFKNKIFNLFERIQLFVKAIDDLRTEKDKILLQTNDHTKKLEGFIECTDLYCDNFFIDAHENIAATIFELNQNIRSFKIELYNYLQGTNT